MNQKILDFLTNHRVCSLTTLLTDGSPHAAALHYSQISDPLTLYFSVDNTSRKCDALVKNKSGKASVVIGFSEDEWITLQMDGYIRILEDSLEIQKAKDVHYTKHPSSQKFENIPTTIFLSFIPLWYRYTDFNTDPPTIISS